MSGNNVGEPHQQNKASARFGNHHESEQIELRPQQQQESLVMDAKSQIAQNHSVNDQFIDNIRAKLDMLNQF